MINIAKSNNVPVCLVETNDHKCCIEQVQEEFFHKCYICEYKGYFSIQTEHFDPNPALRLDWNNLFYSCGHCNGIKSNKYIGMLNCTDFSIIITDVIKFEINPLPKEKPIFSPLNTNTSTLITIDLLNEVHNSKTKTRQLEANKLNDEICNELNELAKIIDKYYKSSLPEKKQVLKNKIKEMLEVSSKFVAFKIWLIKSNTSRLNDFQDVLPTFVN